MQEKPGTQLGVTWRGGAWDRTTQLDVSWRSKKKCDVAWDGRTQLDVTWRSENKCDIEWDGRTQFDIDTLCSVAWSSVARHGVGNQDAT